MHLVWRRKKGSSMEAKPQRVDYVFGEGMTVFFFFFSERFVFSCKKNYLKKKKERKSGAMSQVVQEGRSVSSES